MALVPGKTVAQMAGESVTQDADLFYFLRGTNDFGITFVDLQTQFMGGITIEAGSQNYLGWNPATSELSMKALAITGVTVDATEISLAAYLAANYTVGDEHQEGDVIYLTAATGGTEAYIHNGGTAVTAADFEIINFPVITSLTGLTDTASASVNDGFLQWNAGGTQVEYITSIGDTYISSAVTWNAKQDALTFGIADTNSVVVNSASVANGEYAKFTASGLESKTFGEVKTDLGLNLVENTALSTWAGSASIVTVGTIATGTWQGTAINQTYLVGQSGTNTGDQTSIVGITGTKAQFDTALTDGNFMYIGDAPTAHTHLLAAGATDVTATAAEVNLLDLAGLTVGYVLSADTATTASWKAAAGGADTNILDTNSLVLTATKTHTINDNQKLILANQGSLTAVDVLTVSANANNGAIGIYNSSPTHALEIGDGTINHSPTLDISGSFANNAIRGLDITHIGDHANWTGLATFESSDYCFIQLFGRDVNRGANIAFAGQSATVASNYLSLGVMDTARGSNAGNNTFKVWGDNRFSIGTNAAAASTNAHIIGTVGYAPLRVDTSAVDNALLVKADSGVQMGGAPTVAGKFTMQGFIGSHCLVINTDSTSSSVRGIRIFDSASSELFKVDSTGDGFIRDTWVIGKSDLTTSGLLRVYNPSLSGGTKLVQVITPAGARFELSATGEFSMFGRVQIGDQTTTLAAEGGLGIKAIGGASPTARALRIQSSVGLELFNVSTTGNVGIGVLSPTERFEIASGTAKFAASTAAAGSIIIPHGVHVSNTFQDGEVWTTTLGMFARINGVTVDLTDTGVASGDGIYDGSGAIPVGTTTITMAANDLHFSAADGFTKFTKTGGDFILDLENTNNHTKVAYQQGNQGNLAITQWFNGSAAWGAARMAGNLWTRAYERDKFALYTSGAAGDAGIDIAAKNAAGVINFHVGGGTGTLAISTERMIIANTTITNKVRTLIGVGVVDATAMTHITGQSSGAINPFRVDTNGVMKALYVNSLAKVFMAGSVEMGATPSTGSGKFTMTGTVGNETLLINSENASSSTSPLTCYSLTNRIFRLSSTGNIDMNGTLNVGKTDNTSNGQLHIFANSAGSTDILTVKNSVLTTVLNVEAGGSTQITGKVQVGGQDSGYLASNGGIGIKSTASVSNSVRVLRMQSNVAGELFAVTTTGKVGIQKLLPTETLEIGTGQVKLAVGTSSKAALMLPPSVAVTSSPLDGEVWLTTTGMFARINGVTKDLTDTGAGADGNGIYDGNGLLSGNTIVDQSTNTMTFSQTGAGESGSFNVRTTSLSNAGLINLFSDNSGININAGTNVGINANGGVATFSSVGLNITGVANFPYKATSTATTCILSLTNSLAQTSQFYQGSGETILHSSTDQFRFETTTVNMSIGATSYTAKLYVKGDNAGTGTIPLRVDTNAIDNALLVNSLGRVNVNNTIGGGTLHVVGISGAPSFRVDAPTGGATNLIKVGVNENIGFGGDAGANYRLHVEDTKAQSGLLVTDTGSSRAIIGYDANGGRLWMYDSSAGIDLAYHDKKLGFGVSTLSNPANILAKFHLKGTGTGSEAIPLRVDTASINNALTVGSNANTGFGLSPAASRRVQIQGETATSGTYSMYVTDSASGDLFTIRNDGYSAFGRTPSSVARLITKGKGTTSTTASFISKNSADTDTLRIGDDGTIDMYNELTLTLSTDSDLRSTFSNPSVGTSARSSLDVNNGTSNLFHEIYSTLYTNTYIRNKGVIRANSQSDGIVINSGNNVSGTIELGVSTSANNLTTATTALFINTNRTVHIGNGVGAPDASAVLEISGSTGGVVVPRMAAATASLISSPIDGNILYVTTTDGTFTSVGIWAREAGTWIKL